MKNIAFDDKRERAEILGEYIVSAKATVRSAAAHFGISKSTVHKDISEKLDKINSSLYADVQKVIEINKKERHLRGGMATKHKYEELNKERTARGEKLR